MSTHCLRGGIERSWLGPRPDVGEQNRALRTTGPKVLLVEPNEMFRASSTDAAEQLAVASPSRSRFWPASRWRPRRCGARQRRILLVDATDFFLRDVHAVAEALTKNHQGNYKLDPARSTIALDRTGAFPKNTKSNL